MGVEYYYCVHHHQVACTPSPPPHPPRPPPGDEFLEIGLFSQAIILAAISVHFLWNQKVQTDQKRRF